MTERRSAERPARPIRRRRPAPLPYLLITPAVLAHVAHIHLRPAPAADDVAPRAAARRLLFHAPRYPTVLVHFGFVRSKLRHVGVPAGRLNSTWHAHRSNLLDLLDR